jgi:ureidoacrylate peracid hydrolase
MDSVETVERLARIEARPEDIEIDLSRTALMIVDMQNVFAGRGEAVRLPEEKIAEVEKAILRTKRLVDGARSAGVPIIYVVMVKEPVRKGKGLIKGVQDTRIVEELTPFPTDTIIEKSSYSGFRETSLDGFLKTKGITHLLIAGTATNVCVESTLRDAYFLDYLPILVSDATANAGPAATQEATLWNVEEAFGWVTTTQDVLRGLLTE